MTIPAILSFLRCRAMSRDAGNSLGPRAIPAHFATRFARNDQQKKNQDPQIPVSDPMTVKTFLITGANAGLGKEAARLLALRRSTKRIYLACRNEDRAEAAKAELEEATGRKIFKTILLDTSSLDSVKAAVASLRKPVDAVLMNAGGPGDATGAELTDDGVTTAFAVNVLGHVALVDELRAANKLTQVAVYVSSEAARGIKLMKLPRPQLPDSSVEDFVSVGDGSIWKKYDPMTSYGTNKYVATQAFASMAREDPAIRFVSVSPGATTGTSATDQVPALTRFFYKRIAFPIMTKLGKAHGVESGAQRYLDVLLNDGDMYETGHFYASRESTTSGPLTDQAPIFDDLSNEEIQDNALQAVRQFLSPVEA
jgi:NAD(P)-dependent dehydrogenase (short-subunit alcohol dehydrogenase family)